MTSNLEKSAALAGDPRRSVAISIAIDLSGVRRAARATVFMETWCAEFRRARSVTLYASSGPS
jgi:hypothetical protein